LDGLTVKDAPGTGVKVNGRHVTLRHCLLHHNGWKIAGDAFGGAGMTTSGDAHDLLLEDNESYENREHGFYVSGGADRPIIRRNKLHDNGDPQRNLGGNGLQINADGGNWPTDDAIIEANIIHGNRSNGISLQGACGSLLVNNLLFDNHKGDIGISKGSSNDRLVNNTIVAGPRGGPCIRISAGGNHGPCRNIALRNNILVADQGRSFCYALEGGVAALSDSDYNLLWAGKDRLVGLEVGKRLTFDECRATGIEKHSLAADPQFRDPAKGDFRLKDTSPAVGAGRAEASVAADLEGVKRKRGPACDLGAFELAQPR
jgi:parallel beta-helix repeat protein